MQKNVNISKIKETHTTQNERLRYPSRLGLRWDSKGKLYSFFSSFLAPLATLFIVLSQPPSKHSSGWRRLEDVFRLRLPKTSSRRLQDVLIKTNMFTLALCLQKTSSRRLGEDQYIRLGYTSSRRLQDVFKTSSRHLQDVFKTSSRHLQDVSSS